MPWVPATPNLGTSTETGTFNYTIKYYTESTTPGTPDPVTGIVGDGTTTDTYYPVNIIPQQIDPATVNITNGLSAAITGYFGACFNDTLTTRDTSGKITTISTLSTGQSVFTSVDKTTLHEVIGFVADSTRTRTFTFVANAYDPLNPTVIIDSQTYTAICQDLSWTPGKNSLKELVNYASYK